MNQYFSIHLYDFDSEIFCMSDCETFPPEVRLHCRSAETWQLCIPSHINTKPNTISIHAAQCPSFLPLLCQLHGMHTRVSCHKYRWNRSAPVLRQYENWTHYLWALHMALFFIIFSIIMGSFNCGPPGWPRLANWSIFCCFSLSWCLSLTHCSKFLPALCDVAK